MIALTHKKMEAIKDKDGTIRCAHSLRLLGYWFKVDNVSYYALIETK